MTSQRHVLHIVKYLNDREQQNGKDMKGSSLGEVSVAIAVFPCRKLGKLQKKKNSDPKILQVTKYQIPVQLAKLRAVKT
jgi:hypothetical protein